MYTLLIDDLRTLPVDVIARTVKEGLEHLMSCEVTHLYLDNDLGDDQMMEGIDILTWARDHDCVPPKVTIVSANPIARKRMEDVLHFDLGYVYNRATNTWSED
jgi:hypothetical protein